MAVAEGEPAKAGVCEEGLRPLCRDTLRGLDGWFSQFGPVMWAAGRFGVEPWVVGAASLLWMVGFLLWGFTGELLCTVIGLLYPMYASFRALEDTEHGEVIEWMFYWVTYAAVTLIESVFHSLLVWVPFYHVLRLIVAVWLFMPSTRGAHSVYGWVISPILRRYRPSIDAALAKSSQELDGNQWSKELRSRLQDAMGAASAGDAGGNSGGGLGIDELVAEELTKAAAAHMGKLAGKALGVERGAEGTGHLGARHRTASPRPTPYRASAAVPAAE